MVTKKQAADVVVVEKEPDTEKAEIIEFAGEKATTETKKPTGYQSVLAGVFDQLEAAAVEARERVEALKAELVTAERDAAAISTLLQIKAGNLPSSFSPADHTPRKSKPTGADSAPRAAKGSIELKIMNALGSESLTAGQVIDRTMSKNTPDEPRVRAKLFSMKKSGALGYNETTKCYSKPA